MQHEKKCECCGNIFVTNRMQTKYCSDECKRVKKRAYNREFIKEYTRKKREAEKAEKIRQGKFDTPIVKNYDAIDTAIAAEKYETMISRVTNYGTKKPINKEYRRQQFLEIVDQFSDEANK